MSDIILTDEQEHLIEELVKWFHDYEAGHRTRNHPQWYSYSGGAGSGKAIPDDELIPTPTGFRYAKDFEVGDLVFNAQGIPTRILGIYPQKPDMTYKLIFTDGRTARCCKEHLWPIYNRKTKKLDIKPLKDFIDNYELGSRKFIKGKHSNHVTIPAPGIVEFNEYPLPIDPWVLGIFLSNGCLRKKYLTIRCENEAIPNMIADTYGFTVKRCSLKKYDWVFKDSNGCVIRTMDFFKDLPEIVGNYSYEKSIPFQYIINSMENRIALLAGLLDADGYIDSKKYRIQYKTISYKLCQDITILARSLGLIASISEEDRDTTRIGYNIDINCQASVKPLLFRYGRKHDIAVQGLNRSQERRYDLLTLMAIEEDGIKPLRCFYVEDPSHLFITGEFVPTHNTTIVNTLIEKLNLQPDEYITCAYTGRAALNLQQKNLRSCTVHSLIYHSILEKTAATDDQIEAGSPPFVMKFHFILKDKLPDELRLIVVDEATMINNDMRDKLISFGKPIIFVGDMNQLPPIFGISDVMLYPDFILTKIMRQAEGNPIVQLANMILNDEYYDFGNYGTSKVVESVPIDIGLIQDYDMILCGKNKTRDMMNETIIKQILKKKDMKPFIGAKVVNRQNNWDIAVDGINLTNGLVGYITNISKRHSYKGYYKMDFRPDFMDSEFEDLLVDSRYIISDYNVRKNYGLTKYEKFEYAYCISTHISQGSEYPKVLFLDENFHDQEMTKKLRYTAITRAKESITIVRSPRGYAQKSIWNSDEYNDLRRNY